MLNNKYNSLFFKPIDNRHPPLVAISACLMGQAVRYDGTDKYLPTIDHELAGALQLRPVCPEAEAGLGTPRPPVRLVHEQGQLSARGRNDPSLDVTAALDNFRQQQLQRCLPEPLCGHILKARSPSCGLNSTAIYNKSGERIATGSGLYAAYFQQHMPWLFFRDESQLESNQQCVNFITACQLSCDLQRGIRQQNATQIKRHYRYLFTSRNKDNLIASSTSNVLILFKQRIEELAQNLNGDDLLADKLLCLQARAQKGKCKNLKMPR